MSVSIFGSRAVNIVFNFALAGICIICYALLIIIFVAPGSLHLDSLVFVQSGSIQPTVVVSLLSALLVAATSALATRCVEQPLWLELTAWTVKGQITTDGSHRLAQWSVSPLARLFYFLTGRSWLLKFGGLFLLSQVVLSPVLLVGITQRDTGSESTITLANGTASFAGFIDNTNSIYNGGSFSDVSMTAAALASMGNLSAPAASTCSDPTCAVSAQAASLYADCTSEELANPDHIGGVATISRGGELSRNFCSANNPDLCVTLLCGSEQCPGEWISLFGAFVDDWPDAGAAIPIKIVDCRVRYGTVNIKQNGSQTPDLDRFSFKASNNQWSDYQTGQWRRIYNENPYSFGSMVAATGFNSIYRLPVGQMLLGTHARDSAATVARRVERNFDMATLFAYAKSPTSAVQTITRVDGRRRWHYEPLVPLVLLVPLLATLAAVIGRWTVTGDDVFIGYNPVETARRGPITCLSDSGAAPAAEPSPYEYAAMTQEPKYT